MYMYIKDLIAFRKRASHMVTSDVVKDSKIVGGFMTVCYHNKGIEMLQYSIVRALGIQYSNF